MSHPLIEQRAQPSIYRETARFLSPRSDLFDRRKVKTRSRGSPLIYVCTRVPTYVPLSRVRIHGITSAPRTMARARARLHRSPKARTPRNTSLSCSGILRTAEHLSLCHTLFFVLARATCGDVSGHVHVSRPVDFSGYKMRGRVMTDYMLDTFLELIASATVFFSALPAVR